jgi:c(7)-type cytochrome triheme protein
LLLRTGIMRAVSGGALRLFSVTLATALGSGLVAAAAEQGRELRLPPDRTYDHAEGSPGPVLFKHGLHVRLADGRCLACHPAPFRILRPTGGFTHEEMDAGRQCGICHDGKKATGTRDDCTHCHRTGGDS